MMSSKYYLSSIHNIRQSNIKSFWHVNTFVWLLGKYVLSKCTFGTLLMRMMLTTSLTEKMKIVSNGIGNLYSIKKIGDGWDCFPQKMIDPPLHPSYNKTVRFFFLLTQYIFFSNEPLFFADLKIIVIEAAEILLIKWKHFSEKVIHSYSLRLDARCFILQKLQCPRSVLMHFQSLLDMDIIMR